MQDRVITMGSLFDGIGGFPLVSMCTEDFTGGFMEMKNSTLCGSLPHGVLFSK